ncbi:MAG: hypothetical protein HYZ60_06330, partial [Methylocystis sp.]|nr:hypothetical protein [Methylocystis sp.]
MRAKCTRFFCIALLAAFAAGGFFARLARGQETAPALEAAEAGPCSLQDAVPVTVAAIDRDFDVLLADGRRVALAGVEFPASTPANPSLREDIRVGLANWIEGRPAFLVAVAPVPDRWGRIPGRLYADDEGGGGDARLVGVAEALLDAGQARFRPDAAATVCAKLLASAESAARERALGLWA